MNLYEARIIFEDKTIDVFEFTNYSVDGDMFKFVYETKGIIKIFFKKDIMIIKIHYVGETKEEQND